MEMQYFALKTGDGGSFKIILNQVHFIARFQNHYLGAFFSPFLLFLFFCVCEGRGAACVFCLFCASKEIITHPRAVAKLE